MGNYYLPGMPRYSTVVQVVEMDALPLHRTPGFKSLSRQDSLLDVSEVARGYDAIAYSMYKFGILVNTHMTFDWNALGINDAHKAVKLLSEFNSDIAKWLRVGAPRSNLQRIGRRQGRSVEHFYVHAHENSGSHGFHTHQICYVPSATICEFRLWAWKRIARLTGTSESRQKGLNIKSWKLRDEEAHTERGWAAFRYIVKQLDPNDGVYDNSGRIVPARHIFKPWPVHHLLPLKVSRAMSCSHNIGAAARRAGCFRSRYQQGAFDEMYAGLELDEGRLAREHCKEQEQICELLSTIQI